MTKSITRRSLVSVAPAVVVAAAIPALATEHRDAALLALRGLYEQTLAAIDVASKPHTAAEKAYFKLRSERLDLDERSLRKVSGLESAELAWHQAEGANLKIIRQIADRPAQTLEGVIFKAEVSDREDNLNPDLVASIIADLVAMGGASV